MARVVVHQLKDGAIKIYSDGGVEVYWVDERTPGDRIYQMSPNAVPAGILDGDIGHADDGSRGYIRAERLRRMLYGEPAFDLIIK